MDLYLLITTTSSKKEAKSLARTLLDHGLIACAQWSKIRSLYRFEGQICHDREYLLTLKTTATALESAKALLLERHSYKLPECVAIKLDESSPAYLSFVQDAVRAPKDFAKGASSSKRDGVSKAR